MTDNEIINNIIWCMNPNNACADCPYYELRNSLDCVCSLFRDTLDLINRQKAEIESIRKKALLEASTKFAGHSNYHGDTILCTLICMAEGQEVADAKPIDYFSGNQLKAEAIKEFAERIKADAEEVCDDSYIEDALTEYVDNLVKEMVVEDNKSLLVDNQK